MHSAFACWSLFFFNDTATTEIYTLSLHDALPILTLQHNTADRRVLATIDNGVHRGTASLQIISMGMTLTIADRNTTRSEEHTSELQSQSNLVCRLLLEKKNRLRALGLLCIPAWCP